MTVMLSNRYLQGLKDLYFKHKKTLYNNRDIIYASAGFLTYQSFRQITKMPCVMNTLKKASPNGFSKVSHLKSFLDREHCQTFIKQGTLNTVAYLVFSRIFGSKEASFILSGAVLYGMQKALVSNNFSPDKALLPCRESKENKGPVNDDDVSRVVEHISRRVEDKDFTQRIILLVGPSGVGKSQLIKYLQQDQTSSSAKSLCYRIDISRLKDKGAAVEDPLNRLNLLTQYLRVESEAQGGKKALLFLDELRYVMGTDNTGSHFFDAFKKFLEEQTEPLPFFIISAMTDEEYHEFAKKEDAMIRRIDCVKIEPRSPEKVANIFDFDNREIRYILHNLKHKYGQAKDNLLMGSASDVKKHMTSKGYNFYEAVKYVYGLDTPLGDENLKKEFSFTDEQVTVFKEKFKNRTYFRFEAIAVHCLIERESMDFSKALETVASEFISLNELQTKTSLTLEGLEFIQFLHTHISGRPRDRLMSQIVEAIKGKDLYEGLHDHFALEKYTKDDFTEDQTKALQAKSIPCSKVHKLRILFLMKKKNLTFDDALKKVLSS